VVIISTSASDERRIVSTIPLIARSVSPLPMIGEKSSLQLEPPGSSTVRELLPLMSQSLGSKGPSRRAAHGPGKDTMQSGPRPGSLRRRDPRWPEEWIGEPTQRRVARACIPPIVIYSTSSGLVQRDGDSTQRALPDIVKHSFLIILGRFRQESTLTSVGDPQLSNQIQVTGRELSVTLRIARIRARGVFR